MENSKSLSISSTKTSKLYSKSKKANDSDSDTEIINKNGNIIDINEDYMDYLGNSNPKIKIKNTKFEGGEKNDLEIHKHIEEVKKIKQKKIVEDDLEKIEKEHEKILNDNQIMIKKDFYEIDYLSIPNYYKKLVLHNMPKRINEDEIKQYFYTFLVTINKDNLKTTPILNLEKFDKYWIIEINTKENINYLTNIDHTEWMGYIMRIEKLEPFFKKYNSTKGENVDHQQFKKDINTGYLIDPKNKLFLRGFPNSATKEEIIRVIENFGEVKYLILPEDKENPLLNKGFCFFEFALPGQIESGIEGLNNLPFGESKLRCERASDEHKQGSIITKIKEDYQKFVENNNINEKQAKDFSFLNEKKDKFNQIFNENSDAKFTSKQMSGTKYEFYLPPNYAYVPSRVIQLVNILTPEELMDDIEYREIAEDIRMEVAKYGQILNIEIPRPIRTDGCKGVVSPGVGKVFIKYQNLLSAKLARFKIAGLKFNDKTVCASFYPEQLFDIRDFILNDKALVFN